LSVIAMMCVFGAGAHSINTSRFQLVDELLVYVRQIFGKGGS
jgi:hypothetical protein